MTLTDNDKQQLAELGHYPAFRTLIALWIEHERNLLSDIAAANTDADALRYSRRYQLFRYCREFLESQPLSCESFMRLVKEREESWEAPRTIDELLHSRFARNFDGGN